jgi:GNAT superfamily N-acetyltransferase
MQWRSIEELAVMAPLPEGYRYTMLARSGIPTLIDGIRRWHPDIAVGGGSCYLREDFYTGNVFLEGEAPKDIFVGLFKHGDDLAGMFSWEQIPDTLSLYGRLIAINPEHRGAKLASAVMPLAELVGRAMGAEFLFGLATLKIPHMQRALEAAGWQLIGFTSGYDREEVAPGVIKRVFEGVYCKVLVPEEELLRPDPKNLTPKGRALFEALFPGTPAASSQPLPGRDT